MGFRATPMCPWSALEGDRCSGPAGGGRPDGDRARPDHHRPWRRRRLAGLDPQAPALRGTGAGPRERPQWTMRSCTATPTSASSTAPASPEELVEEAVRLGLTALAITDHDGFYGVVRFAEAARRAGPAHRLRRRALPRTCPARRTASPTRTGAHLLVLARGPEGYARLCRVIAEAQLAGGEKGRPVYDLDEVAARAARARAGPDRLPQGARCRAALAARRRRRGGRGAGPADRAVRRRATWWSS